jgi:hypothetical protein
MLNGTVVLIEPSSWIHMSLAKATAAWMTAKMMMMLAKTLNISFTSSL